MNNHIDDDIDTTAAVCFRSRSDNYNYNCVCSWKNCDAYQTAFQKSKAEHPFLCGVVHLTLVKDHNPAHLLLKESIDHTLQVPEDTRYDWKYDGNRGEEVIHYRIARHHFTEKHVEWQKRHQWTSLLTKEQAQEYLFKLDPKQAITLCDGKEFYVQCPNVSKVHIKQLLSKLKVERKLQRRAESAEEPLDDESENEPKKDTEVGKAKEEATKEKQATDVLSVKAKDPEKTPTEQETKGCFRRYFGPCIRIFCRGTAKKLAPPVFQRQSIMATGSSSIEWSSDDEVSTTFATADSSLWTTSDTDSTILSA